jgi:hypothetical protein
MTGTCIKLILGAVLLIAGGGSAFAENKTGEKSPGMEFLEFLGAFETADGKMIDPLNLPALSQKEEATAGTKSKKASAKNTARKKEGQKQ